MRYYRYGLNGTKFECTEHSYAWSGNMPNTGKYCCVHCGKPESEDTFDGKKAPYEFNEGYNISLEHFLEWLEGKQKIDLQLTSCKKLVIVKNDSTNFIWLSNGEGYFKLIKIVE